MIFDVQPCMYAVVLFSDFQQVLPLAAWTTA